MMIATVTPFIPQTDFSTDHGLGTEASHELEHVQKGLPDTHPDELQPHRAVPVT